ncbi:hypothetical protein CBR_g32135 [Chara braunii]|uniref:Uncharacterized protein n=1 Tax=Chara braunii TaxID=69332 RepID=A0A388JMT9_CHABU|nr:hypothetical protein CBR_g32135 [Chara braunii]|eukprot:GBG59117.1 hypothetical protein CBR_g32135 [Chara braunii]
MGLTDSHERENTSVYDDGDIELFLDEFRGHAEHMGWTVAQRTERLRGVGRFEEPIARIRREARTWPEIELSMSELRPSPMGPDGVPIRLKIVNVEEFIPAFEQFMHEQNILRDEWALTLPLWTRKAERLLVSQITNMARDWASCRAHLREVFRRPKPPQPRVERRQRSKRQRGPEAREAISYRGGRKALARREESVPEVEERGAYPECGLGRMVFHRFTDGGLRGSPQLAQEEMSPSGGPLQELEAHLDISRWRVHQADGRCDEPVRDVPREEVHKPGQKAERGAQGERVKKEVIEEVIEVGEDTLPRTLSEGTVSRPSYAKFPLGTSLALTSAACRVVPGPPHFAL